jgi:hypothetical protein
MAEYKPTQYPPTPLDTKGHLVVDYSQVNAQLQYEAGRFDRMISGKLMQTAPWNRLVVQDEFPESMGTNIQSLMWERVVLPEVGPAAWTDLVLNDGSANSCIPNPQILEYARTVKSYNLQQSSFRSPYLCVEDIRYAFKFGQQTAERYKVLEANSSFFTTNRYRDEYLSWPETHRNRRARRGCDVDRGSNQAWPASRAAYALDQGCLTSGISMSAGQWRRCLWQSRWAKSVCLDLLA